MLSINAHLFIFFKSHAALDWFWQIRDPKLLSSCLSRLEAFGGLSAHSCSRLKIVQSLKQEPNWCEEFCQLISPLQLTRILKIPSKARRIWFPEAITDCRIPSNISRPRCKIFSFPSRATLLSNYRVSQNATTISFRLRTPSLFVNPLENDRPRSQWRRISRKMFPAGFHLPFRGPEFLAIVQKKFRYPLLCVLLRVGRK